MIGPIGSSVPSQGGVDAFLHGMVAFARPVLGPVFAVHEICLTAGFGLEQPVSADWDEDKSVSAGFGNETAVPAGSPEC